MPTNMPNFPHMQVLAVLQWIVSQVLAFGVIKHAPSQEVLSASSTLIGIGLAWADSQLRGKRVIAHAIVNAGGVTPAVAAVAPETAPVVQVPPVSP